MKNNGPVLIKDKLDLIFMIVLFLISFIAWFIHSISMHVEPSEYRVKVFTSEPKTLSFIAPKPDGLKVKGLIGITRIEWNENGLVRISDSACKNKTCVKMGWVNNSSVVCVPNGILVEAIASQEPDFDAVSR